MYYKMFDLIGRRSTAGPPGANLRGPQRVSSSPSPLDVCYTTDNSVSDGCYQVGSREVAALEQQRQAVRFGEGVGRAVA